ncbi:MAG: hypothetical protein IME93_05825 [Proteobacteria bacterium]|nr:hypothetical protein [Pseudomonadota bacterium]
MRTKRRLLVCAMTAMIGLLSAPVAQAEASDKTDVKAGGAISESQLFKHPGSIPGLIKEGTISADDIPNPHWRRDSCSACHKGKPTRRSHPLHNTSSTRTCNNCHEIVWPHSYVHPVGVKPDRAMRNRMSKSFRRELDRSGGRVSCTTCHDLRDSCLNKKDAELENPIFFRGGAFGKPRTDICYQCHDRKGFQRLNPHKQMTKSGKIIKNSCRTCHSVVPDGSEVFSAGMKFNVGQDLSKMCLGCHPTRPHPGASFRFGMKGKELKHLVVPSDAIARRLDDSQQAKQISLPLEPGTGKLFCGTCHNAHEKGIIRRTAAAKGADSDKRLREQKICIYCHVK